MLEASSLRGTSELEIDDRTDVVKVWDFGRRLENENVSLGGMPASPDRAFSCLLTNDLHARTHLNRRCVVRDRERSIST
jgi:hypothetical protein